LTVLILGAVVANINLAIANVALPSIGAALDTSQAELNLVAVGFTLGCSAAGRAPTRSRCGRGSGVAARRWAP
jgi:hypothetical protein